MIVGKTHLIFDSYYLPRAGLTSTGQQQKVEAFPAGFQMIAGDNFKRNSSLPNPDPNPLGPWPDSSQEQRAQRALGFNCLHYAAGNDEPSLMRHEMPSKDFIDAHCTDGIRLELFFPSCWNGQKDSTPGHKSHVAYPDGVQTGNCPKGYDRRLISLFYETIVATDHFKGKPGQFVLANGDPTGYGYHGDFISAWKDNSLEAAINTCGDQLQSGNMRDCSVFTMTQNSDQCKISSGALPASIQKEDVKGPMKGLANGLQVFAGPQPAPMPAAPAPAPAKASPPPALPPSSSSPSAVAKDQNVVPTAHFSGPSAPLNTNLPAEPHMGEAHEKIVVKSRHTSSPSPSISVSVVQTRTSTVLAAPLSPPHASSPPATTPPAGANSRANAPILSSSTEYKTRTVTTTIGRSPAGPAASAGARPVVVVEVMEIVEEVVVVFVTAPVPAAGVVGPREVDGDGAVARERDEHVGIHRRGTVHGHGHGHGHMHHHRYARR